MNSKYKKYLKSIHIDPNSKEDLRSMYRILNHLDQTITCGFHSGFPPCCIKFYVTKWLWEVRARTKFFYKYYLGFSVYKNGYVACPSCRKNKTFVKVRKCPNNLNCWHGEENG